MTRYDVTAWCSFPHYTTFEVDADSIDEALGKAQAQAKEESPEPCDGASHEWNEFELCSEDTGTYIRHLTPERAAEIAASTLLGALKDGVNAAKNVTDSWESGDLAQSVRTLSLWLADASAAIKEATESTEARPCA